MNASTVIRGDGPTRRGEQGFTLLEVLVAISILGLLMLVMSGGLQMAGRMSERAEWRSQAGAELNTAVSFLRRRLEQAHPLYLAGAASGGKLDFAGDREWIEFIAPLPQGALTAGLGHYRLQVTAAKDGRRNLTASWMPLVERIGPPAAGFEEVLVADVAAARLDYFGARRPHDRPAWHTEWHDMPILPGLVRLRVIFPPQDRRRWQDLIVRPMVSHDAACLFDPVSADCAGRT